MPIIDNTIIRYTARRISVIFILLLFTYTPGLCQNIGGAVIDIINKQPIRDVNIENIHNSMSTVTNTEGEFNIAANSGHLLVFKKTGYNTVYVRIPDGIIPPYFKITMEHFIAPQIYEAHDWKYDSTQEHELYKHELEFPTLSTWDMIQHPFYAMDQHNRQIWAFQEQYKYTEQEKYVDHVFNRQLISHLTGLGGDSLSAYMRKYRPTYELVRNTTEYNLYGYIRKTVLQYRKSGHSSSRVTN